MIKLVNRYLWKVLTDDGLLKEPADQGPPYARENINEPYNGYPTEEAAVERLKEWMLQYHCAGVDFTLVKIYRKE